MANQVLKTKALKCFLNEESGIDDSTFPAAGDAVVLQGELTWPTQPDDYEPMREILNSYSAAQLTKLLRAAGAVSFNTYSRPSGSAGTAPAEGPLLVALGMSETIVAGTSVTYAPSITKNQYSLWIQTANGIIFCTGLTVTAVTISQEANGSWMYAWTCKFARLGWTGETTLTVQADLGATSLTVANGDNIAKGSYIDVGSSTVSYKVTAITDNTVTITPALDVTVPSGSTVSGTDLPTPTIVGTPSQIKPIVKVGSTAVNWRTWSATIEQDVAYIEDEIPADPLTAEFPTDWNADDRTVSAELAGIMRTDDLQYLKAREADQAFVVDAATNAAAGSKCLMTLAQGRFVVPSMAGDGPTVSFTMPYKGKSTDSMEDELSLVFT